MENLNAIPATLLSRALPAAAIICSITVQAEQLMQAVMVQAFAAIEIIQHLVTLRQPKSGRI